MSPLPLWSPKRDPLLIGGDSGDCCWGWLRPSLLSTWNGIAAGHYNGAG